MDVVELGSPGPAPSVDASDRWSHWMGQVSFNPQQLQNTWDRLPLPSFPLPSFLFFLGCGLACFPFGDNRVSSQDVRRSGRESDGMTAMNMDALNPDGIQFDVRREEGRRDGPAPSNAGLHIPVLYQARYSSIN